MRGCRKPKVGIAIDKARIDSHPSAIDHASIGRYFYALAHIGDQAFANREPFRHVEAGAAAHVEHTVALLDAERGMDQGAAAQDIARRIQTLQALDHPLIELQLSHRRRPYLVAPRVAARIRTASRPPLPTRRAS